MKPTPRPTAYTAEHMRRQLSVDGWVRVGAFMAFGVCLAFAAAESTLNVVPAILMAIVAAAWIAMGVIAARVTARIGQMAELIHEDPNRAETELSDLIGRRPLPRNLRLLLYHKLAMLRHRQQNFFESARICRAVLDHRTGVPQAVRCHLLLMLAEASLHRDDLFSAHTALTDLHGRPLNLLESLQHMALQLHYEIRCGHDEAALATLEHKVQMAELLPAGQCGIVHLMLAAAARRARRGATAQWLMSRAELLCTPQQMEMAGPWTN